MSSDLERVAVKLARFALPVVTMRPQPGLLNPAIRAAVLIDLALTGTLTQAGDLLEVDTTPTGFAPADHLLEAVTEQPDKPLAWWLYHAPISIHDIAHVLVAAGVWDRHGPFRRYRALQPQQTAAEQNQLLADLRRDYRPTDAATTMLLNLLPIKGWPAPPLALDRYGAADWLVPDLEASLRQRLATLNASAQDARNAQSANFIF